MRAASLVLAAALVGCGSKVPGDGGADAAPDVSIDEGVERDVGPVCTSPTACNDDAMSSEEAGVCNPLGAGWFCGCNPGFSVNPRTGRCRAGTACVAGAADPWGFEMSLDTTDCASRAPTGCATTDRLSSLFLGLMTGSCRQPASLTVRVELVDGCPTLLELGAYPPVMPVTYDPEFGACFSDILSHVRIGCSTGPDCYMETMIPIGTL